MSDKKPRTKAAPPRDASAPLSTNADVHEGAAASVAVQVVPIGKLKANPKNPRVLRDEKFAKLKKSLTDFPDMLNKRPLVGVTDTDGKIMVLGGNQDELYKGNDPKKKLLKAKMLESVWPQYAKTVIRFNRYHHYVDWNVFKSKAGGSIPTPALNSNKA